MFRLVKILNGRINQGEPVKLPTTPGESYSFGEALVLNGGKLTKCGATTMPTHICGEDYNAPSSNNRPITAEPISADMIFEVPFSAAPGSVNAGDKVTLGTDGLQITATTASGVATIFDKCGASATGDKCLVQFK
ncbi:MAG: hypothetical protein IKT56_02840 [Clostridia bacterium]|nr:hypothetical protein [Clostridia bacterium]